MYSTRTCRSWPLRNPQRERSPHSCPTFARPARRGSRRVQRRHAVDTSLTKVEATLTPKIDAAERAARARSKLSPAVADLVSGDRTWDDLDGDIEAQRTVVRELVEVVVLPSKRPRGTKSFDRDAVQVQPIR